MPLPATTERVRAHTSTKHNEAIARCTEESVRWHASRPEAIPRRLRELDREWDVERALEANAATVALAGVALGAFVDRRFFAVPGIVAAFLLQHALQGWCPPLPVMRRLGFRTQGEIESERTALRALRGDFQRVAPGDAEAALAASRAEREGRSAPEPAPAFV